MFTIILYVLHQVASLRRYDVKKIVIYIRSGFVSKRKERKRFYYYFSQIVL